MQLPAIEIEITADPNAAIAGFGKLERAQDSLETAQLRYQQQLAKIAKSEKSGLVTKANAAKAIASIEKEYKDAATAAAKYVGATAKAKTATAAAGKSMQASTGHAANLGAQFNDIGIMLAAGQSPLMLAVQQGSQINQVFAQMGGGKKALSALSAGIMQMVSPLSLLTLGVIAGGAALVQWGVGAFGASEDAKALKERMDELRESMAETATELRAMRLGVSENELTLIDEVAARRAEADRAAAAAEEVRGGHAKRTAEQRAKTAQADLEAAEALLQKYREQVSERDRLAERDRLIATRNETHLRQMAEIFRTAQQLNREAEQTMRTASAQSRLKGIEAAFGRESLQYASEEHAQQRAALEVRIQAAGYSEEMANKLRDALAYAQGIAGLDMASGVQSAAVSAADLANQFGIAYSNAYNLAKLQNAMSSAHGGLGFGDGVPSSDGIAGRKLGFGSGSTMGRFGAGGQITGQQLIAIPEFTSRSGASGKSGGGGGGGGGTNPLVADLEALRSALATERELIETEYKTRLEKLDELRAAQMIGQEEFQNLSLRSKEEYLESLSNLDQGYHGTALDQAGAFFGDMATAFAQGNEKMVQISQSFAAVEALINAYRAYTQTIADPSLPFVAKLAAGAQVFAAGMGAVNAIKGASTSGGGSASSSPAAAAATPQGSTYYLSLVGDTFPRDSVKALMTETLQSEIDRGGRVIFS